jgi:protein associated with RNAse G/E
MAYTQMVFQAFADAKNTGNYFELNLNQSLDITDNKVTYKYYDIDEDVYDDRLKYIMDLKKHFYILQKDYVRFINFDKSLKAYNIYNLTKLKN